VAVSDEQQDEQRARRWLLQRQIYHALFYLGTLLAVVGWYIDIKGAGRYNESLLRLSVLALVGHALQVVAGFGLLLMPDAGVTENESYDRHDVDDSG
jgi:hypothetical protein